MNKNWNYVISTWEMGMVKISCESMPTVMQSIKPLQTTSPSVSLLTTNPIMQFYVYKPQPHFVDCQWTTTGHVYVHLINNPARCKQIMSKISTLNQNQPFTTIILHPLLPGHLTYSIVESDSQFLHCVENLLNYEEGYGNLVAGLPLVCVDLIKVFYEYLHAATSVLFSFLHLDQVQSF